MWFHLGIQDFLLKKRRKGGDCEIFITNMRSIWFKNLKNEEILTTCKRLNPLFEAPDLKLIEKTLDLFSENAEVSKELNQMGDEITLHLKSNIKGIQFEFQLVLLKGDNELMNKELTLPLFLVGKKMHAREHRLIQIIKDKDAEISEYKMENISIKRGHLITEPFIEKEFKEESESNSSLLEVSKNPCQYFDKAYQTVLSTIDDILETKEKERKAECNNVKQEPNSLNNDTVQNLENFAKQNNIEIKHEKVPVKVETFDVKKRKIQKNTSKLKF